MGNCLISKDFKCIDELQKVDEKKAKEVTYDFNYAKVVSVYDGDTITIVSKYNNQFMKFKVRLYGIDTPEIKGETKEKGLKSKQFVNDLILNKVVRIEVLNNKIINGKKITEKYGRLLAKVWTLNGDNISELLINEGLAKEYYGGTK